MKNKCRDSGFNKEITLLANPYSPHVRHWEDILFFGGYKVTILTAHPHKSDFLVSSKVTDILPFSLANMPMFFRYIMTGLFLRFSKKYTFDFIHAHNTSGYGLSALLSGAPFIITTYGSEIFNSVNRGWLYRYLIKTVLKRAMAITSASPKMTELLITDFGIDKHKIHEFSLGVSNVFFYDQIGRNKIRNILKLDSYPVWCVNRRIHPLYHTVELIKAFVEFRRDTGIGFLLVLEGDSDPTYLNLVEKLCVGQECVKLIRGFKQQDELRAYLSAADFSISVPESDQLSSSILEGAACGAIPLLANLESYSAVKDLGFTYDITNKSDSNCYKDIFYDSYKSLNSNIYEVKRRHISEILKNYQFGAAFSHFNNLVMRMYKRSSQL